MFHYTNYENLNSKYHASIPTYMIISFMGLKVGSLTIKEMHQSHFSTEEFYFKMLICNQAFSRPIDLVS